MLPHPYFVGDTDTIRRFHFNLSNDFEDVLGILDYFIAPLRGIRLGKNL